MYLKDEWEISDHWVQSSMYFCDQGLWFIYSIFKNNIFICLLHIQDILVNLPIMMMDYLILVSIYSESMLLCAFKRSTFTGFWWIILFIIKKWPYFYFLLLLFSLVSISAVIIYWLVFSLCTSFSISSSLNRTWNYSHLFLLIISISMRPFIIFYQF